MKVISGTVVGGKIEIPADTAAEGEHVMVVIPEAQEAVRLSRDEEEDLVAALDEIRRGEYVDGADLVAELRHRGRV